MLPNADRRDRRRDHNRRRPCPAVLEPLEDRDLPAVGPLGVAQPDLTVSGTTGPIAAWGGPLGIHLDVRNLGASSTPEPLALSPGAHAAADVVTPNNQPVQVLVFASKRPRFGAHNLRRGRIVPLGTVNVPTPILQNSLETVDTTITLPQRPRGFPGNGGKIYVGFAIDPNNQVPDADRSNNIARDGQPVVITPALPDLHAIALDVPSRMQPGDVIAPSIKVANFGTVDPASQGPVTVALVASNDTNFGPGDHILATYTLTSLPPLAAVPMKNPVLGDVNVNDPANVDVLTGQLVTLPSQPATYFLGVIVDPENKIRELHEVRRGPSPALVPVVPVGPPIANLPPAGVQTSPAPLEHIFPIPPFGAVPNGPAAPVTAFGSDLGSPSAVSTGELGSLATRRRPPAIGSPLLRTSTTG
ncbi:MAG: hypothetical protein IRY99_01865 [Isosphaeraceae bacterium]|nr:hypothetical protein [Isosphaeraceae bacterium]